MSISGLTFRTFDPEITIMSVFVTEINKIFGTHGISSITGGKSLDT
jgi:hypothetical protein